MEIKGSLLLDIPAVIIPDNLGVGNIIRIVIIQVRCKDVSFKDQLSVPIFFGIPSISFKIQFEKKLFLFFTGQFFPSG